MRFAWIAILFLTTSVFGQDTLDYKSLIASKTGEHVKFKFYSSVTNTKQQGYLKDGKWTYSTTEGYLVKEENFKAFKAKQRTAKDGYEVFYDPQIGDTVLIRKWNKGRLELQHAYKPAIIADGNKVYHIYYDFESFTVAEYEKKLNGPIDRNFTSIWKSTIENPDRIKGNEAYLAFEDSVGDPSLLQPASFDTKARYNYVSNAEFEIHPQAPFSIMSFTNQLPGWSIASESPDFYLDRENAHSGKSFVGFRVFTMQKDIEYLQNQLKEPLKKDSTYCFSAYLKLSPGSKYATNAFGILFTDKPQYINTDERLTVKPSISLSSQVLNFKTRWMKVQCTYKAKGGEKFMVLGSFQYHKQLELIEVPGELIESYYYLDDVSLVPVKTEEDCGCNFSDTRKNEDIVTIVDEPTSVFTNLKIGDKFVLDDIHFMNDEANLLPESFNTLADVLAVLKDKPLIVVEISGHTSSLGGLEHNMRLSERRAEAVKKFLTVNGIEATCIKTAGYGPKFPIADDATEAGQLQNRRVEFKVLEL